MAAVVSLSTPPLSFLCSTTSSSSYTLLASLRLPSCAFTPLKAGEAQQQRLSISHGADAGKWRTRISFFPSFLTNNNKKRKSREALKSELLEAIASLDRGAEASPEDQQRVDQIARDLEAVNRVKQPLKSDFLNGKWELLYTTSSSVLGTQRPKLLRPNGKIYQSINTDTLRAQNMETWPFYNQRFARNQKKKAMWQAVRWQSRGSCGISRVDQCGHELGSLQAKKVLVTANLVPLNSKRVAVRFDTFKILGLIPIKAPGRGRGELEITYLDDEIRISRGDKGNLFILKMVDPSYRVPPASS